MEPQILDPQLPNEQSAQNPNSSLTSSNVDKATAAKHSLRLVWHLYTLCDVVSSTASSWLSLQALGHETFINGAIDSSIFAYEPSTKATALMLHDLTCNLTAAMLMQTALHQECLRIPSYGSLISAANIIPQIMSLVPGQIRADNKFMPSHEVVEQIQKGCNEITELCHGNTEKGVVGWKECFSAIKDFMAL